MKSWHKINPFEKGGTLCHAKEAREMFQKV
jgi:hypothetical protein